MAKEMLTCIDEEEQMGVLGGSDPTLSYSFNNALLHHCNTEATWVQNRIILLRRLILPCQIGSRFRCVYFAA